MSANRSKRKFLRRCKLPIVCLAGTLLAMAIAPFVSAAQGDNEPSSLVLPVAEPQGITREAGKIWVVDEKAKKLDCLDPGTGGVIQSFAVDVRKPRGVVFDGKHLWIADEETRTLHAISPESGKTVTTLKMEIPKEKGFRSVEGVAWDGKYLWVAYAAGFSSSYNQIDTESGRIVRSIFADCDPRGIASDGEYLYSICYNGKDLPSKIDRRKILDKEHDMLHSRIFIKEIHEKDPSGLMLDGDVITYVDRASRKTYKVKVKVPRDK